jgi:hypothetical protein
MGAIAATQLWLAIGKPAYADHAQRYGRLLLECQQRRFDGLAVTGYFHTDTSRESPINDTHESNQDLALRALRLLAESFPDDRDWMEWYGAGLLYSEYFLARGAESVEPYRHLPNRVWRESEIAAQQDNAVELAGIVHGRIRYIQPGVHDHDRIRQQVRAHFDAGVPVGAGARLRINPLYIQQATGRGSNGYLLAATSALAEAALLRNRTSSAELARMQLQWLFGGNPFAQSLMHGVGYDYCTQWANDMATSVVGALPVGIDATTDDAPLWTDKSQMTVKETWVVLPGKLLASIACLGLPAKVTGSSTGPATFSQRRTRTQTSVDAGDLDLDLEPGDYIVEYGGIERRLTLSAGKSYDLRLDHDAPFSMRLEATDAAGTVAITARFAGRGRHEIEFRAFNARLDDPVVAVELDGEEEVELSLTVLDPDVPWCLVAVPDGRSDERQELFGTAGPLPVFA